MTAAAEGIPPAMLARALAHHGINISILESPTIGLPDIDRAAELAPDLPIVVLSKLLAGIFADDRDITVDTLPQVLRNPDPWVRAMGTTVQGVVFMFEAKPDEAEQHLHAAIAEFEQLGDQWAKAMVSGALGELRAIRGDTTGAVETLTSAAELAEWLTADDIAAQSLLQLALVRARSGDLVGAQREIDRARIKARAANLDSIAVWVGVAEAEVRRREGDLVTARAGYADGLAQLEGVRGTVREIHAGALAGLAVTEHELGHREAARTVITKLHGLVRTWRERPVAVMAALATAAVIVEERPAQAAYLVGVADALRGMRDQGNPDVDQLAAAARAALGEGAFTEAYEKGRAVDLDGGLRAMEL